MLKVCNVELDFDITAPVDIARYIAASEKLAEEGSAAPLPPVAGRADKDGKTVEWLKEYQGWVTANCKLFTDWIDEVFGDGTANKLLGSQTSLVKILETYDLLEAAMAEQGENVGARLRQFAPNRRIRQKDAPQ